MCLKENDTVLRASQLMRDHKTGCIPIVDDNNKACGMLTDRDIVIRCVAEGQDGSKCQV